MDVDNVITFNMDSRKRELRKGAITIRLPEYYFPSFNTTKWRR